MTIHSSCFFHKLGLSGNKTWWTVCIMFRIHFGVSQWSNELTNRKAVSFGGFWGTHLESKCFETLQVSSFKYLDGKSSWSKKSIGMRILKVWCIALDFITTTPSTYKGSWHLIPPISKWLNGFPVKHYEYGTCYITQSRWHEFIFVYLKLKLILRKLSKWEFC